MRVAIIALSMGCSYQPAAVDPVAPGGDAPGEIDGQLGVDAGPDVFPTMAAPFVLSGEDWLLPCITNGTPNGRACTCAGGVLSHAVTIGGEPGERWVVTVRIRGVMERITYNGGVAGTDGWYVGGNPGDGANNFYRLDISAPAARYFINRGNPAQSNSWPFDYQETFEIDAGATVTFAASGQDQVQWEGVDPSDQPISIPGISDPAQPYNGQFAQLDVLAAVLQ